MNHQFEKLQEEQGWTEETLLQLLLNYVDEHDLNESVNEYLVCCAEEENADS